MSNLIAFESERGLIAGILIGRVGIKKVSERIPTPDYFAEPYCKMIYGVMLSLLEENKTPDLITITEKLEGTVSTGYIAELTTKLDELEFGTEIFDTLIANVVQSWAARSFDERIRRGESAKDVASEISASYATGTGRYIKPQDLAGLLFETIWKHDVEGAITFPFKRLNTATRGLRGGEFAIVAGRTTVGKSSMLENVATHNAFNGKKVLLAIAEMGTESIGRRILSRITGIPLSQRKPTEDERKELDEALDKIASSGLHIYDQGMMRTTELEEQIRKEPFDLICVDYLQLFEPGKKYRSQYERVTYASAELKGLAVKFNIPFLVAAQFNRQAEGKQPTLAQLRDSGALEQDADMVISLWAREDEPMVDGKRPVYVDLLKNRNGWCLINSEVETHRLWFDGARTQFVDEAR